MQARDASNVKENANTSACLSYFTLHHAFHTSAENTMSGLLDNDTLYHTFAHYYIEIVIILLVEVRFNYVERQNLYS